MTVWMDGWMDGWMVWYVCMYQCTCRHICISSTSIFADSQIDRQEDRKTNLIHAIG